MPKLFLDIIRWILIIGTTILVVIWLWTIHWALGLILAFPMFVILMNVFGFLTLPLYAYSKEARITRRAFKDFVEKGSEQQHEQDTQ